MKRLLASALLLSFILGAASCKKDTDPSAVDLSGAFYSHGEDGYFSMLDEGYPVATCRFYELDRERVMIGRVVVLPEYRGSGLGRKVILEAESWIRELGYTAAEIESRTVATGFYLRLGYEIEDGSVVRSGVFECVRMRKDLKKDQREL